MHTTTIPSEASRLDDLRRSIQIARLEFELTMLRAQTHALETLERLMDDPQSTGNEKTDKANALERNRQRLAANQVLIHCRTAQRENRLAQTRHSPASPLAREGGRACGQMRRRPESSDHQDAEPKGAVIGAEGADHPDTGSTIAPSPAPRALTNPAHTASRVRSRYKVRKPKHPRQCRKRKRRR